MDIQFERARRCIGRPGDGMDGRDVRRAGAAAFIVQDLGGFVIGVGVGHFLQILLHIRVRDKDGLRVLRFDIAVQQAGSDGVAEGEGGVIGLDVPVHRPGEALLTGVIGLESYGLGVVVGQDHLSARIRDIGNHRVGVPFDGVLACVDFDVLVIDIIVEGLPVAVAVEGDAEDDLLVGDSGRKMLGNRLVAVFRRHGGRVEGAVVLGRVTHVVGHHVDEVHVLDRLLEVHVFGVGGRCHGQEPVLSERRPQVMHQQREVLFVIRRRRDARRAARGIFPVDVDAVQAVLGHGVEAVLAEGLPVPLVRRHLAEVARFPAAYGQEDLQVGILLLEGDHQLQAAVFLDVQAFKVVLDMGESVVDVRQQLGIRQGRLPVYRVAYDDGLRRAGHGRNRGLCSGIRVSAIPVIAVVSVVPVVASLLARRLVGNRDDDLLLGLVACQQQRQHDKEEGYQSFHSGGLFVLMTNVRKSLISSFFLTQFGYKYPQNEYEPTGSAARSRSGHTSGHFRRGCIGTGRSA